MTRLYLHTLGQVRKSVVCYPLFVLYCIFRSHSAKRLLANRLQMSLWEEMTHIL